MDSELQNACTLRFAFFGGQGSRSSSSYCANHEQQHAVTTLLLAACHSAFVEEVLLSRSAHGNPPWADFEVPATVDDILFLPSRCANMPILQGVSLCLNQLATYIQHDPTLEQQRHSTVAGFCSGLLPAAVVASSTTIEDYIDYSKGVMRIAYWIGYRAAELSYKIAGHQWRDLPWALSVLGMKKDTLEKELREFNSTIPSNMSISLSSRFGSLSFSLVGPGSALDDFKSRYLTGTASTDWVYVHALYHAGDKGKLAKETILSDIGTRGVVFPTVHNLHRPLWCCHVGSCIDSSSGLNISLLECILSLILQHDADLYGTWSKALEFMASSGNHWEVLTIGPGSHALLASVCRDIATPDSLTFIDLSPASVSADRDATEGYAIVGMSVNFPAGASKTELWDTLDRGLNAVQEIPTNRFHVEDYQSDRNQFGPTRDMRTRHGNFLSNPFAFDHSFFGISPREAKSMDPQQKLLLQCAVLALDDAGYVPYSAPTFNPETMGCYVGVATDDYLQNLARNVDVYYSTGTLRAFLSGKISYAFGWSGPSVVTDTACSSSLVSISLACRALANGDCSTALAGGVNVITSPDMYLGLSRAHFLSPTGQCKPFDASADGYCRAEGCGLFVIKRLQDAVEENDRIYAVIRGVESNQCGNASSITHPHAETQKCLIQKLLSRANINPSSISVVEAHGTGTQAGDAVETASLDAIFGGNSLPVYLTSIKGNIGHAEAASGSAGLAKLLLMLQHSKIPPQVGLQTINPKLRHLAARNIHIPTQPHGWNGTRHRPRRALLNNFGAAGSNAALLLEEFTSSSRPKDSSNTERAMYNFVLSAKNAKALDALVRSYRNMLSGGTTLTVRDLCYTATARRQLFDYRVSFTCENIEGLAKQLESYEPSECSPSFFNQRKKSPVIFVFSGQGSVYKGMGKQLLSTAPVFHQSIGECDEILRQIELGINWLKRLNVRKFIDGSCHLKDGRDELVLSQVACFAIEYALASLWLSWGVKPDAVIGHSLGEYVGMVVSGVLTLKDALWLVTHRAHLMSTACEPGETTMLACNKAASDLRELFTKDGLPQLVVACENSKTDSVISGPLKHITRLREILKAQGVRCKQLDVPLGYHSAALDPILEMLEQSCQKLRFASPRIPLGSCLYGRWMETDDLNPWYVSRQTRSVVRFADLVQTLKNDKELQSASFIEIGPSPITLPMIRQGITHTDCLLLPSLAPTLDAWKTLCSSVHQLALQSVPIVWRQVFHGSGARLVDLPGYPFQQESLYVPFAETPCEPKPNGVVSSRPEYFFLLKEMVNGNDTQPPYQFKTDLAALAGHIRGHSVGDFALCPASVFYAMILEAAQWDHIAKMRQMAVVTDLSFKRPLLYEDSESDRGVFLTVQQGSCDRQLNNFTFRGAENVEFCSGGIEWQSQSKVERYLSRKSSYIKRQLAHLQANEHRVELLRTNTIYNTIFPRVVTYSEEYQSLKELSIMDDGLEAYGTCQIPQSHLQAGIVSPVFVDTLLHAAGFLANSRARRSEAFICAEVENVRVVYPLDTSQQSFTVYCSLWDGVDGVLVGDSFAMTHDRTVVAAVEGMHFKQLNLKAFQWHLSRHAGIGSSPHIVPQRVHTPSVLAETSHKPLEGDVHTAVVDTIANICEQSRDQIRLQNPLSSLGVDSLMRIELSINLKNRFPAISLDSTQLMNADTVQDLQQYVLAQHQLSSSSPDSDSESNFEDKSSNITPATEPLLTNGALEKLFDIVSVISEVNRTSIHANTTLKELGIDSLMAIELQNVLSKQFNKGVPSDLMGEDRTIQDLAIEFDTSSPPSSPPSSSGNMICLRSGPEDRPPLILFHDGSGLVDQYRRLAPVGCTLYGVFCPDLANSPVGPSSMVELAISYSSVIMQNLRKQRVVLGGWSFGGVLAHEVAEQLDQGGYKTAGVILFDSPSPCNHQPLPQTVVEQIIPSISNAQSATSILLDRFQRHAHMLAQYQCKGSSSVTRKYIMLHCEDLLDISALCGVEYAWLSSKLERSKSLSQWSGILNREISIMDIPGNHFEVFHEKNISTVSQKLKAAYLDILKAGA